MRALVIDDSRAMRVIIGQTLKGAGFEISEAGNGREALSRLEEMDAPDLIMVDWNMPEMSGIEFLKAVRQMPEYNDTRIIMVTTETEMKRMAEALSLGANEYVMKPFTRDILIQKLDQLGLMAV